MHNIIYSSKSIDLVEDTAEDTVYLSITDYRDNTHYTEDFTKEELVVILKDMIKVLESWKIYVNNTGSLRASFYFVCR